MRSAPCVPFPVVPFLGCVIDGQEEIVAFAQLFWILEFLASQIPDHAQAVEDGLLQVFGVAYRSCRNLYPRLWVVAVLEHQ